MAKALTARLGEATSGGRAIGSWCFAITATVHRFTVITSEFGRLQGQRIVAGREAECERYCGLTATA